MTDIKFKPLSNYIVLEIKVKDKAGNIIIPDTATKPILESVVVAISEQEMEGKKLVQSVKIGDKVLFNIRHAGEVIDIWGKQYVILRETDLFGILEDNPDYKPEPEKIIKLATNIN